MITRLPGLLYGGDYNPEQWPEQTWRQDAALMREAGVNLVTLGVFSWARLQPAADRFDFDWLDRLLDLFAEHDIGVDLATATASPPAWLVRAHPTVLPVTADGVRLEFGSRQHYCPSSPVYRSAATRLARAVAERYHDHPALVMWHIHNEYGDHVAECFCAESATDFRRWLRRRYGSPDALNHAWGTDFWSQRYGAFDEVEPPRTAPAPVNPTQLLDWRRFCSDALLVCHLGEQAVLDEVSPDVPVTTNFMSMFEPLDYWAWAAHEDVVSDDSYPDPADPVAHVHAAMNYDLMRSLKGGDPWLLMEQAPSAVSWRPVNVPKPPELRRLWSLQAVAHGADGVLHFQWRASVAGAEKFHSALLPHRGTASRGWAETVRFGAELARLGEVAGSRTDADVAIVLDWDSWWALELDDHPSQRLRWLDLVRTWYSALHAGDIAVDFVPPPSSSCGVSPDGSDPTPGHAADQRSGLAGYRVVLVPNLYLVRNETAEWLSSYVAAGGSLVCGFFSGVTDADDHIHPGGPPGPLRDLLGVVVDEHWPIPDGASIPVAFAAAATSLPASLWSEWVETTTADVVARYEAPPSTPDGGAPGTERTTDPAVRRHAALAGRPAVTRNAYGAGHVWYVSCHLGEDIGSVLGRVLHEAGVRPVADTPPGVEAVRRGAYLFLLNHTDAEAVIETTGVDLLTDTVTDGALRLPPLGAAVLRTEP